MCIFVYLYCVHLYIWAYRLKKSTIITDGVQRLALLVPAEKLPGQQVVQGCEAQSGGEMVAAQGSDD